MMKYFFLIAVLMTSVEARGPFAKFFPLEDIDVVRNGEDPGKPLFVTPYIEKGDIKTARLLSRVGPLPNNTNLNVESYAGYFTVNTTYDSNLYFWFFPTKNDYANAPVLLWLQGGPGGSSMLGLFIENGPFSVENMMVVKRKFAWTDKFSMLYIDNPVGTGFSFTSNDAGYATTETDVAENLYRALVQFYQLFPEIKKNDFYLTGESYAGKYVPALAHRIHTESHPKKILLRGMAIGDGFSDPPTMIHAYSDLLYNIGAFDETQRDYFTAQVHIIDFLLKQKQYKEAYQLLNEQYAFLQKVSGGINMYNYLKSPPDFSEFGKLLALPAVRKSIHVGDKTFNSGTKVEEMLVNDIMQTVTPWLSEAMNYYKVCLYSGQLDIIVGAPLTELMLQNLSWVNEDEYKRADRMVWRLNPNDTDVAGYVRRVHDFYQVIVRGGGHILPFDQPERSFDMIDRFISGKPFA